MSAVTRHCHYPSCENVATKRCGNCKITYYCSKDHQLLDWQGDHREVCKKIQSAVSEALSKEKTKIEDNKKEQEKKSIINCWKGTIEIDPEHAYAYYEIAFQLLPNSTTMLKGKLWSSFDLLKRSISLNTNFIGPLTIMALLIPPNKSIVIGETKWDKIKLNIKAIELDPEYYVPYHNLSVILSPDSTLMIDGKEWTKKDLYKKARGLESAKDKTLPPHMEVYDYYREPDNIEWRKKTYREEIWGDQSLPAYERMQQLEKLKQKGKEVYDGAIA